jgi:hypothetical protein
MAVGRSVWPSLCRACGSGDRGKKGKLNVVPATPGVTPAEVCDRLADYGITPRSLVNWRQHGHLPPVTRVERADNGRGAEYRWPDDEVVGHITCILDSLDIRGRMDSATVMSWFCGFDYPGEEARARWLAFEYLSLEAAVRHAGGGRGISLAAAARALVAGATKTRMARRFSVASIRNLIHMEVDPGFDAGKLTPGDAAALLDDLRKSADGRLGALDTATPEHIRVGAALLQDYLSGPRLVELIRHLDAELLAQAHADLRFLTTPYRSWCRHGPVRIGGTTALRFVPRLMWQVGRWFLLADIALRRRGFGEPLDMTMKCFRSVADDPENQRLYALLRRTYTEWTNGGGDPHSFVTELVRRAETEDDFHQMMELPGQVGTMILEIWRPHVGALTRLMASTRSGTRRADDR